MIGEVFGVGVLASPTTSPRDSARPAGRRCRWPAAAASRPGCRPSRAAAAGRPSRTSTSRSMPRARSFFAVTGPTPHSASTGSCCRNGSTRSGLITVSPSGFFQPDAIFARNLFGATPADAVRPVSSRMRCLQPLRDRGAERLAPRVLGDVEIRLVERQRLDERRHLAEDREHRVRRRLVAREIGRDDDERRAEPHGASPSASPSARRTRALRSSRPRRRRGGRAGRRRRPACRAAPGCRAARPTRRTRPCRCGGFGAYTSNCRLRTARAKAPHALRPLVNCQCTITRCPMPQFIYTMKGLGKVHPPDTKVLEDIWLSFLLRREDRRARPERRRQELAAEDHGRRGHELHRRSVSGRRHLDRLPAPGAAARSDEDRPRQRRGGRRRDQGAADALRRGQREARRGSLARRDGEGPRRAVAHPGQDRRVERVGPRLAARAGDGRAAAAAARRRGRRRSPAASAAASRCAGCCCSRPTCCCSTSRPTTSTPNRSPGSSGSSRTTPARSSPSRTIATSSTTSPAGFSSSIAAAASRGKATTRRGSSRSRTGCSRKRRPRRASSGRSSASSNGSACRRARARRRARRA